MLIPCPHCGPRHVREYTYAGDATRPRPALDAPASDWCAYLFERDNPRGAHVEYWQHTAGCRSVLVVERDTVSHAVGAVRMAAAPPSADIAAEPEPAE